jgi:hypothetical protein
VTQIFPQPVIPTGYTIAQAMSLGLLPAQTQIQGFGVGAPCPTLGQLISDGLVSPAALASTLSIANPANYGGN